MILHSSSRRARTAFTEAVTRSETSRIPIPGLSCSKRLVSALAMFSSHGWTVISRGFEQHLCNVGQVLKIRRDFSAWLWSGRPFLNSTQH
jgi:hypothetical protein